MHLAISDDARASGGRLSVAPRVRDSAEAASRGFEAAAESCAASYGCRCSWRWLLRWWQGGACSGVPRKEAGTILL